MITYDYQDIQRPRVKRPLRDRQDRRILQQIPRPVPRSAGRAQPGRPTCARSTARLPAAPVKQFKPVRYSIWISGAWRITFEWIKETPTVSTSNNITEGRESASPPEKEMAEYKAGPRKRKPTHPGQVLKRSSMPSASRPMPPIPCSRVAGDARPDHRRQGRGRRPAMALRSDSSYATVGNCGWACRPISTCGKRGKNVGRSLRRSSRRSRLRSGLPLTGIDADFHLFAARRSWRHRHRAG